MVYSVQKVFKVGEGRPDVVDEIKNKQINLVVKYSDWVHALDMMKRQ